VTSCAGCAGGRVTQPSPAGGQVTLPRCLPKGLSAAASSLGWLDAAADRPLCEPPLGGKQRVERWDTVRTLPDGPAPLRSMWPAPDLSGLLQARAVGLAARTRTGSARRVRLRAPRLCSRVLWQRSEQCLLRPRLPAAAYRLDRGSLPHPTLCCRHRAVPPCPTLSSNAGAGAQTRNSYLLFLAYGEVFYQTLAVKLQASARLCLSTPGAAAEQSWRSCRVRACGGRGAGGHAVCVVG